MNPGDYAFTGFTAAALDFLRAVREHNSKEWYDAHRGDYQNLVLAPMQALVADLVPAMLAVDPAFEIRPAVGKTISRLHRDTRFSRDKSLYRDAIWCSFKRPRPDWSAFPAFYFELSASGYRYGMGYYAAPRATMDALRRRIDAAPRQFAKVSNFLGHPDGFILYGDLYKRPLSTPHPPALQTWYQRKSFYLMRESPPDKRLFSAALVACLQADFASIGPFYRYLQALK
ncbi:MAG TPA: TIGR02453 family protein [Desulfuromonas sp.]|nr:TIGR02453 family protein [Desulfuromonas sp.]